MSSEIHWLDSVLDRNEKDILDGCVKPGLVDAELYRCLRLKGTMSEVPPVNGSMTNDDVLREKFLGVLPRLIDDVLECPELKEVTVARDWYKKVLEYNTVGGKLNRGLLVVECYESMAPSSDVTDETTYLACVLGWCLEMLQAWLLLIDDIMDQSVTRRGQPCWYLTNDLGPKGANDGLIIEAATYYLLKKYFKGKSYYTDILEVFHSVTFRTTLGQCLDTHSYLTEGKTDFKKTSTDLFLQIAKYKTAYYTLYMPVCLGMLMAGKGEENLLKSVEEVVIPLGIYFQVQDDYLDCFGDPEITGKIGSDIHDGKCTWLLGKALELGSEEQISVIKENYSSLQAGCVSEVKRIYSEIGLVAVYEEYENRTYKEAVALIENLSDGISKEPFWTILRKLYKRSR